MSYKKNNQIIDELAQRLFVVEGEITDLLTSETMQNLNFQMQNTTGAIAIGSVLAGQIGNAALANFAASDEGIEVSDFAVEIADQNKQKYYFTGCFPVVIFKKGDTVKVVAEPDNEKYARAVAIIDQKNHYIWTGQEVVKGRFRYRVFGMWLFIGIGLIGLLFFVPLLMIIGDGINTLKHEVIRFILFIYLFIYLSCWRMGCWKKF